ncbi:MAG: phage major capsid protein [Candidatus Binatia bacterium]
MRSYLQDNGLIKQPDFRDVRFGQLLRAMLLGPKTDLERRALAEGTDSAGGYSVPDITLARFIDLLQAAQVVMRAGAQTVPLTSDRTTIARTASDPTIAWRNENAEITPSDMTFEGVILTPRSLACLVVVSRELVEDSLNIESALEAAFIGALSVELDRVALRGTGTPPQPRGIVNVVGINEVPATGPFADYDDLIDAMAANWADNSPMTSAIVMSPFNLAALAKLKEQTTSAYLKKPDVLDGVPMMMTSSMDDDTAIVGDFSKLIVGIRTSLRIEVLRERYAEFLQFGFLAFLRADVAVEHPESFCKITNLTTS